MPSWKYIVRLATWCVLCGTTLAQTPAFAAGGPSFDRQQTRDVQRALTLLGLDPGPADGVLGPRTKAAVTRFQQAEGLTSTGVLDPETRSRLAERQRDHVRKVQTALKQSGQDPGPVDGLMGGQTKAALRRYAAAPAPSPPTPGSQLIEQFRRVYESSPPQSP